MISSAIGLTGWFLVALAWICWAAFVEFSLWRGRLAPLKTAAFRGRFRVILYGFPVLLTLLVGAISVRPIWAWYSTTSIADYFALGIIATGAITAWAGSLVAFTISKRVTPRRSFGLRLLAFALLLALLPMGLSGAVLRSALLMIILPTALLGRFQSLLISATKDTKFASIPDDVAKKLAANNLMHPGEPLVTVGSADAFADWLVSFVHGGPYWMAIALGALGAFLFPTPKVLTTIAGVALLWGMRLLYRSIVEPFTPRFLGDALDQWRKEHFIVKAPGQSEEAPAVNDQKSDERDKL